MSFLPPNQQYQSIEVNSRHWTEPLASFLLFSSTTGLLTKGRCFVCASSLMLVRGSNDLVPQTNTWPGQIGITSSAILTEPNVVYQFLLLWTPCVADADIIFFVLWFLLLSSSFFPLPNLSGCRVDVCHTSTHANLECRSEMCCTQLAENTGRKRSPKNRHLHTIAQLCQAISSQLRHVSTNLLSSNISSTCLLNMVNFGPLAAEIGSGVCSTHS